MSKVKVCAAMRRKIVVHIATSADGFVARPDGNLDWLTDRVAPKGVYGLAAFERFTAAKILGRKTFERSLELGATFGSHPPPLRVLPRSPLLRACPRR